MIKSITVLLLALLGAAKPVNGQYLETFTIDNKGYKQSLANDLSGVNWTLSTWDVANRDVDDYAETGPVTGAAGTGSTPDDVFGSVDLDQEICWTSPKLVAKTSGTFTFTADHTWNGFDPNQTIPLEFMNTEYQLNGGAWVRHANIIGANGDPAYTVRYTGGTGGQNGTGSTSMTASALFQNTMYVRVCWSDNANAELTTLDNVRVTNFQTQPTFTTATTQTCSGSNSGSITVTATAGMNGSSTFTYSKDGGVNYQSSNVFNNLGAVNYSIVVKDGGGITSEAVTVSVTSNGNSAPTVTCPGNTTVNLTDPAVTLTGGSPSGGVYTGTGVSGGQFNPAIAGVGTHTITYTYSNGSCSNSCTFTITVQSGPTVTCPASSAVCINAPAFALTGGTPSGGTYSGSGVSGNTFDPAAAGGAGPKTITYTVGATSCTFTITVNALPTPAITFSDNSGIANNDGIICTGASASLTATGGTTYLWHTGATTAVVSATTAGTYTVTVTNANGCTASATASVVVNPLPTASITISDNSGTTNNDGIICSGATATLTATGGTTYLWHTGATTATVSATIAGTYTVTVTNANGCTASATTTVVVNPLPTAGITISDNSGTANNDGIICSGATATLTATGGTTYLWHTGATTAAVIATTAGTYTVTVTNANGCSASATTTVVVNPLPTAGITISDNSGTANNDGIICSGATATLTATGGTTYLWHTGATTAAVIATTAGTNTVTVTNANGCTASATATVVVNPLPTAGITISDNSGTVNNDGIICTGATATLTATGGTTYLWHTGATTATVSATIASTYTVTVTNANGCTASATATVVVNPLPTAGITISDNSGTVNNDGIICSGATATLTATGGTTYLWHTGATTAAVIATTAGTYTVTVTNANGCTASATTTVVVNPLPTAGITISDNSGTVNNDGIICSGATATLTATGGTTYLWHTGATTAAVIATTAGTYTVTVTNANGCTASATATVVVNPLPTAGITISDNSGTVNNDGIICTGATATLTATGGTTYLWHTGATTAAVIATTAGTYTVTVTNANGCTASSTATVVVNPLPTAGITISDNSGTVNNDGIICSGATATLTATGGTTYLWHTGATTAAVIATTAGTYTVTVTNANGCTVSATTTVVVNPLPSAAVVITENSGLISNDGVLCAGDAATLSVTGSGTYLWSTGATTSSIITTTGGVFSVTLTDVNGCVASSSNPVTFNQLPSASVVVAETSGAVNNDGIICSGDPVTLTAAGGNTYLWSTMATTSSINVSPLNATTYTVTVTSINGCTATAVTAISTITCSVSISGIIKWENNNDPVKDVGVALQSLPGFTVLGNYTTASNGEYSFTITPPGDFRVKPSKNTNLLNGLTAADATRVQQHIANNPPLPDPYKRIAADVNKSNSITTYDATLITQVLANNPAAMAVFNSSWRFVPQAYVFPNPSAPWSFPEKIDFTNLNTNQTGQDFIGIKIGDVNGSANPLLKPINPVVWSINNQTLKQDEIISVSLNANRFKDIAAFQMALDFDPSQLEFVDVASTGVLDMTDDNFGAFDSKDGKFRAVWSAAQGINLHDGTGVFTVKFKALAGGVKLSEVLSLDEQLLEARAYSTDLVETGMSLEFTDAQVSGTTGIASESRLELLQNRPNPFTDQTSIGFILPADGDAQLRIYNISGRLIMEMNKTYTAGYQQESINLKGQTGVLYYELTTPFGTLARKMMVTN